MPETFDFSFMMFELPEMTETSLLSCDSFVTYSRRGAYRWHSQVVDTLASIYKVQNTLPSVQRFSGYPRHRSVRTSCNDECMQHGQSVARTCSNVVYVTLLVSRWPLACIAGGNTERAGIRRPCLDERWGVLKFVFRPLVNVICKQSLCHRCFRWFILIFKYLLCNCDLSSRVTSLWICYKRITREEACFNHFRSSNIVKEKPKVSGIFLSL